MATLEDPRLPVTSPPAIPHPPSPNLPMNRPDGRPSVGATMTQEEIDQATADELAAREQDMVEALAEEEASNTAMAALEGAFVPNGIFRHRGVGPIKYETKRGLVSVFPGDLVCKVTGPSNPDAPEAEWDLEEDWIICSQAILSALLFSVPWKQFPDELEYRAARIGEERRASAPPPGGFEELSQEELDKLTPFEREEYARKLQAAQDAERRGGPGTPLLPTSSGPQGSVIPSSGIQGSANQGQGITPGNPGTFGPEGAPSNLVALKALSYSGPPWTNGQHVVLGDNSQAHWNGQTWVQGAAF